ncbi:AAA family ATPase [Actinacidiphila sp. bgisy167]|uniref:AAA family ATPase n=1 Tax=Actinacidiphila sp. bgisy167 TaxID=3413797 RepID=UPI003D75E449
MTGPLAVLVNGLPGAGKTTLARTLSRHLRLPLFCKDVIKEAHADVLGAERADSPQRRWNASLGAAASETMWALLADAPAGAVLESCWSTDSRGFVLRGLNRADNPAVVEIWCDVPLETARRRFEARHPRHPIHGDLLTDDDWERWRRTALPLQVGPTLHVDTTRPVDPGTVVAWVRAVSRGHSGDGPNNTADGA